MDQVQDLVDDKGAEGDDLVDYGVDVEYVQEVLDGVEGEEGDEVAGAQGEEEEGAEKHGGVDDGGAALAVERVDRITLEWSWQIIRRIRGFEINL